MANSNSQKDPTSRVLVKLRPSAALRAAESRAGLRPLHEPIGPAREAFGVASEAQWFMADLPEPAMSPWDLAHGRIADQLGVAGSDILHAEPDLVHDLYVEDPPEAGDSGFSAVGESCRADPQEERNGKAVGTSDGWHLGPEFSQLAEARAAVQFGDRRTLIAHLDTGFYAAHTTLPRHVREDLQRNFVDRDGHPTSAEDPDNKRLLLDNSGHGTGTLSILAGREVDFLGGEPMGGAPEADVVPLRVADSVVLLRTSAFVRALNYAVDIGCDVLSMSMGGLPSRAWREAVDRAYLAGLCMVTAAGNNFAGLPTRNVVYPARYSRVIAACGVMANGKPYSRLKKREMEGNFGPDRTMNHALAAYTPNIPWAVFGCRDVVRRNGAGTSAATPQVAAAVALWYERYKHELPRDWRRVEAVRKALFSTAASTRDPKRLGRGLLRASAALGVRPDLTLPQTPSDGDSFAFLRVITGLGLAEIPPREQMFNLEVAQLWLLNPELQEIVPDPDDAAGLEDTVLLRFMEALLADDRASAALRRHVASRYPVVTGQGVPAGLAPTAIVPEVLPACGDRPALRPPSHRRLRVYAVDPSFSTRLDTAGVNEVTLHVRWEALEPGPVGEYLEIDDLDAAEKRYDPVDLDDPRLLAQDGWAPAEGNAEFHQQMVYAVAMKTIGHFERALGRPVLWRHRTNPQDPFDDSAFVQRLHVRPHALRQGNAFYSPSEVALQFGYFETSGPRTSDQVPGSRVYACLSHDIVAHETTHAILDGMHQRFGEPTNPDVLAFHEGFADIVALMQHFTIPEVLKLEIGRTRGDLEAESMLGSLAVQFGRAIGGRGALRDAIGTLENGVWKRLTPDPSELHRRLTPHARGAILVAAVFDAFIAIYRSRTADLLRIYTGGTGVLSSGAIHPDLVDRLTHEAATTAGHVLNMCIRALDYMPPVDITFFEYLRALITADYDLMRDDRYNYRVAFVEAFRRRGIYPLEVDLPTAVTSRTLSVDTLRWQGLDQISQLDSLTPEVMDQYEQMIQQLKRYAEACHYLKSREELFDRTREERATLHGRIAEAFAEAPDFARQLGLDPEHPFEVHQLRAALRNGPDGRTVSQVVVSLTQTSQLRGDGGAEFTFRGGSTLVIDLDTGVVKYRIRKDIGSEARLARTSAFVRDAMDDPLRGLFFAPGRREPFAALHSLADEGL